MWLPVPPRIHMPALCKDSPEALTVLQGGSEVKCEDCVNIHCVTIPQKKRFHV
jgi:hypothetical protein